jgi:glyoxylase-like metal-dependent hydrolase (beta-lactamase superfamily II)
MAQAQPGPPGPLPKLVKVKDDLYLIQNVTADLAGIQAFGGNIAVYLTNDGVILVDTKNDRMHDDVVAKVKSLTDKPIKYVILTHNHADHASGAAAMAAIGATVIISAGDLENLARAPNAAWVPQFGYVGQAELMLGGKEVRLREVRGHTRGDTLVYFPAARVACGGDLFTSSDQLPLIVSYADGGNWMDLSNAIDELLKLDFEVVIPGHGSPVTRQEVVAIRNRVVAIRERFRALVRERKTQEEITATLVKEFNWGTGPAAGNIPGMMQELR